MPPTCSASALSSARGNNAASTITTTYDYGSSPAIAQHLTVTDNLGHATYYTYDTRANKTSETDALGNETDRQYNIADQLLLVTYPATGQTGTGRATDISTYLYPNGPILTDSKTDESGTQVRQVVLTYGSEGELLSQVGDGQPEYVTYDALYRPATFSDGKSQATTYTYNSYGYAASEIYPNGDKVQFTSYDQAGHLLTQIDPRGVESDYSYTDPESRLTDIKYPATPALNVHFHYDGYGRQDAKTDGAGSYTTAYDDLGRMTAATTTYTGVPTQTIAYGYYPDGSYQSMTTPAGTFSYAYDAAGRIASLTNPFGEVSSWAFLDNNWLSGQNSGGVVTAAYTHNQRGLITDLTNRTGGGTLLSEFGSIGYDAVGNMVSVTSSIPTMTSYGGTTAYAYDSKNELTQEQGPGSGGSANHFGYDGAGNPTTFKGATSTFNAANQNTANVYDAAGNPTTYKGVTLTFDAENRMTAYSSVLTNGYRGDSKRAWKQNSGGRTYFLYSGSQLVCELNSSGSVTATNTVGSAGLISRHTSAGSVFYTFDAHSSVVQRLDGSGNVLSTQTFDAYGARLSTDGNADPYAGYGGQSGYYTDWETGTAASALELLMFRYYDPSAGRFLTRDPIGYQGGANDYEYVSDGPTGGSDALGLFRWNWGFDQLAADAACAGIILSLTLGSGSNGNGEDYNNCIKLGDCITEVIATIVKVGCEESGPVLAGCAEGLASGIGHAAAEAICDKIFKPCEPINVECMVYGAACDVLTGCLDGFIGGLLDENKVKEGVKKAVDAAFEAIMSFLGMNNELACDNKNWF